MLRSDDRFYFGAIIQCQCYAQFAGPMMYPKKILLWPSIRDRRSSQTITADPRFATEYSTSVRKLPDVRQQSLGYSLAPDSSRVGNGLDG